MAKHKIDYERNTTYTFDHVYQKNGVDSDAGMTLFFTVKTDQYDSSTDDSTALIKKTYSMNGATTTVTISPGDIADTVEPGDYFFDIKIKESDGPPKVIYPGISGTFSLMAHSTNRES
jgi:hypothetical protein